MTAPSPQRAAAALAGLRAYQQAPRGAHRTPRPEIARAGRAALRDFGPENGRPLVVVPSLINPPDVLDLDEHRSFLRWLATQGWRPLLVDWGTPDPTERALDIAGHVETMLLPLLDGLGEPPALAGYCLGGTMAIAAARLRPIRALALIAAPWRFSAFPGEARNGFATLWQGARPVADRLGLLPIEALQAAFWQLDPDRTVAKFEAFGRLDPDGDKARGFVRLEDWANDGAPLTFAAGEELVERLFGADVTGRGAWQVAGTLIDPAAIRCPVLDIRSTTDRIVPAASAAAIGTPLTLALGHVGLVAGGRAPATMWRPLSEWLAAAAL